MAITFLIITIPSATISEQNIHGRFVLIFKIELFRLEIALKNKFLKSRQWPAEIVRYS